MLTFSQLRGLTCTECERFRTRLSEYCIALKICIFSQILTDGALPENNSLIDAKNAQGRPAISGPFGLARVLHWQL